MAKARKKAKGKPKRDEPREERITMEIVVESDGTIGDVRILKSLDQKFGLDDAAVEAARQWRFEPATLNGQKVPVICQLEMEFRLQK